MNTLLIAAMIMAAIKSSRTNPEIHTSPYCGLYSVKAAASVLGKQVEMNKLISPEYFHSGASTSEDLVKAIESVGLKGVARSGLTMANIRQSKRPIILHVRSFGTNRYMHWILFLGVTEDGNIRVYDPPLSKSTLTPAELRSIWDGVGIYVMNETDNESMYSIPYEWIVICLGTGVSLFILRKVRLPIRISVVTLFSALLFHLLSDGGFIGNKPATGVIKSDYFKTVLPEIEYTTFEEMRFDKSRPVHIIDARNVSAFQRSHVTGAINVPITSGYVTFQNFFKQFKKDSVLIFYCQSSECAWADDVANLFSSSGYSNIYIYRGGISEWQSKSMLRSEQ
jgi:rhodanese-related sulfurtransferase